MDVTWLASLNTSTDIYVDSVAGNDSGAGTQASPYKTLAKVSSLNPVGRNIYAKCGSVFHEQFAIPTNSYVGKYGVGANPKITGAETLNNASFTLAAGWTNTYQYALTVPPSTNPYVGNGLVVTNVLMVWANTVRMGALWSYNCASVLQVELTNNSFWYDTTNHLLYIHPADNSDPTTNGVVYEASIRTLCLHGGTGFTVEDVDAEKCYAYDTSGQQGYQLLGYGSGTYRRCSAKYSWNHCAGVATAFDPGNVILTFDSVVGADTEVATYSGLAGTIFVGYRQPNASTNCQVVFTNCQAFGRVFSNSPAAYQTVGFHAHGQSNGLYVSYLNCSASNCYAGFQWGPPQAKCSALLNCAATNCYNGVQLQAVTNNPVVGGSTFVDCSYGVSIPQNTATNTVVVGSTFWRCNYGVFNESGNKQMFLTNCVFYHTNNGSINGTGSAAIYTKITNSIVSVSNSFLGVQMCYVGSLSQTNMAWADYNRYYLPSYYLQRIAFKVTGSDLITVWGGASGWLSLASNALGYAIDAHSTTNQFSLP